MGSVCLMTLKLSPVRIDWSILRVVEWMVVMRMSAGILSPTVTNGTKEQQKRANNYYEFIIFTVSRSKPS